MNRKIDDFKPKMNFHAQVVQDLGENLYSDLPAVLSELIANSLDAKAKKNFCDYKK